MARIEISQVDTPRDRSEFIKFPWRIYKNDPVWVPPLILERKVFLDRKRHPFYEHGDAALFLARRNGEVVGRIMASDDPNYNSLHQSNVGCFGMFESIDDRDVAAALLEKASDWLRTKGRTEIMGPIDYSTNYVCALLIDGFQHPPTLLTSHNPPYYAALIEGCGFVKKKDWYAWFLEKLSEPMTRLQRLADARSKKHAVTFRPFNLKNIKEESERLRTVYNNAWQKNWGFVPFTEAETEHMAKEMKPIIDPHTTLIAEVNGQPVAFAICVIDINRAFRHINGRLTWLGLPVGLVKLLYYKARTRVLRFIALGVVEEFRRAGISETLVLKVIDEALRRGMVGEMSMTLEDNLMINRFIEAIGGKRYKTYRIYGRDLTHSRASA